VGLHAVVESRVGRRDAVADVSANALAVGDVRRRHRFGDCGGRTETPPSWRRNASRQTPFEILSERFARGEINRQEYEERKGLLSQP